MQLSSLNFLTVISAPSITLYFTIHTVWTHWHTLNRKCEYGCVRSETQQQFWSPQTRPCAVIVWRLRDAGKRPHYYIHLLQQTKQRLPALTLNKQDFFFLFWAVEVSDCADCLWEGFIKDRGTVTIWRCPLKKGVFGQAWTGNPPEALPRNRRNSCPWHIRCTQMSVQRHVRGHVHAQLTHTHTHTHATLKLSLLYHCLRARFCRESSASTGWAQEKPRRPTPSNHNLTSPALPDRWRRPHVSFSLRMLLICAYVWTQPL